MDINFKRSRKKGRYFPCQTCEEMQYRKPYRVKLILAGKRRVFCKEHYLKHLTTITPPEEFAGPDQDPEDPIIVRQRKGRKHAYLRREEKYYEHLSELQKKVRGLEFTIAKLDVEGHVEAAKQLRSRIADRYRALGATLDEDHIAKLVEEMREES